MAKFTMKITLKDRN